MGAIVISVQQGSERRTYTVAELEAMAAAKRLGMLAAIKAAD